MFVENDKKRLWRKGKTITSARAEGMGISLSDGSRVSC